MARVSRFILGIIVRSIEQKVLFNRDSNSNIRQDESFSISLFIRSSSYLKQDIYTLIQAKPGSEKPPLRLLYSKLFNNVTRVEENICKFAKKGLTPEIPEDLYHLIKKAVAIRKHLERNRKDKDSLITDESSLSDVTCGCNFNASTICHVTNIKLQTLNLVGELPDDFANLPFLSEITLTGNFLIGSIPKSWASLRLVTLSLVGNLIGGTIPIEIGNISTLEELLLQDNNLTGTIPRKLGKLHGLKVVRLSGNNFTGRLPETFANLKILKDFRIGGSGITGRIPGFIGEWT
ncbi:hypothetical protein IFM89_022679 [Coptis chinensis]|uniref:Ribosomal protein S13 n=1 Tax=Coptis chinensis TaxID=261450 RepID=A0A835LBJ0_9MAGN|nr:hypothetical protein IFM89_022679 [Coptis chinensis]